MHVEIKINVKIYINIYAFIYNLYLYLGKLRVTNSCSNQPRAAHVIHATNNKELTKLT